MFTTPGEIYEHSFRVHRNLTAVREDTREFTYKEIWTWSDATIDQLRDLGVDNDDVVGIFAGNRAEWVVIDTAIARMGAVRTPANYMSAIETVVYQLKYAGAKVVVADYELGTALLEQLDVNHGIKIVQLSDPQGRTIPGSIPHVDPPGTDVEGRDTIQHRDPDARSSINFTGGTTGKPKAVLHSARSAAAALYIQMIEAEIGVGERMLVMSPLAHAGGALMQAGIARGANVRILDSFDAQRTVDLLVRDDITWTFMVPTMIYRVLDVIDELPEIPKLALRTVLYGAAPMSPTRLEHGLEVFGQVFIQLFGQTEAPQFCTRLSKLDHDVDRPELLASCGNPSLFTEVRVTDDHGNTVPIGELGEISVLTPFALTEYIGNPEATAEKFWDDWVRTGDMGTMDDQGYVYLKDRRNDMIISGGFNVYSREVEDVLSKHPQVSQSAVVGIPHPDWGEAVHAVIVLRDADTEAAADNLTEEELIEFCRNKLAGYARPKTVEFVTELPLTPFGKIDKKVLRAAHWEGMTRAIG